MIFYPKYHDPFYTAKRSEIKFVLLQRSMNVSQTHVRMEEHVKTILIVTSASAYQDTEEIIAKKVSILI